MTVSQQIIEVLDNLAEKFGVAIDWTGNNVIPAVQSLCAKYLSYEIGTSIIWMCVGVLLTITGIIFAFKTRKVLKENEDVGTFEYESDVWIIWLIITVCALAAGIPMIVTQVFDIVRCMVFPEYQIFTFIRSMTRGC